MIDGVIASLNRDIMPELTSQKAVVAVIMMQTLLEGVKQRIPVELQLMASEYNQMVALYRQMAATIGDSAGPAADRMRKRAVTLGARAEIPVVPAYDEMLTTYREFSEGLVETLDDLDALIQAGNARAEAALQEMRTYLGTRSVSELTTYLVGAGMAGRG
jgi:soluble cytochrome b562